MVVNSPTSLVDHASAAKLDPRPYTLSKGNELQAVIEKYHCDILSISERVELDVCH